MVNLAMVSTGFYYVHPAFEHEMEYRTYSAINVDRITIYPFLLPFIPFRFESLFAHWTWSALFDWILRDSDPSFTELL